METDYSRHTSKAERIAEFPVTAIQKVKYN